MKKSFSALLNLALVVSIVSLALMPSLVGATTGDIGGLINGQLEPVGDIYGDPDVSETALSEAIAEIIQIVLGFLGVIFIVLIIYAGFVWMTAAGNEEKITTAKKTMIAAIIGVTIVLLAYAITSFVITNLINATTGE